ncbi:MAG: hypothetical protein HRU20_15265 [Pseudomonadales bacterium]|nr:hypothetical protein [Pseudomonadales bacterium]
MNQHRALQVVSIVGVIIFTSIIAISFLFSKQLEVTALEFIKGEIILNLNERVSAITGIDSKNPNIVQKLFLSKYKEEVPKLKSEIADYINIAVNCVSDNGEVTIQQIDAATSALTLSSELWQYETVRNSFTALSSLVKDRYETTWSALQSDIRFFSAVNLGSFLLLLLISTYVRKMPEYLMLVSWLLVISTISSICIYIYGQNWFYTILFNKYYGTGYFILLSFIFLYLLLEGCASLIGGRSPPAISGTFAKNEKRRQ